VTVEDNVAPNALCQDITVYLNNSGFVFVDENDIDGGSTDACGIASISTDAFVYGCGDIGPNTATLTVTDVNGNVSTCTSIVTVEDTVPPTPTCKDITLSLDANGNANIGPYDLLSSVSDNCGSVICACDTLSQTQFDCDDIGVVSVTVVATDVNGNVSTCTSQVTVEDNIAPNAVCQDITVQLDGNGQASVSASDIDGGSNDNCSLILSGGGTFDGMNSVTLTATDSSGNSSTCNANVTVEDNIAPTAVCQDVTVQLDANGAVVVAASDIDGGSSDNCNFTLSTTNNIFTCDDITDGPRAITLTVTDANGNVSTCQAMVTTVDTTNSICCPLAFDFEENAMGNSLAAGTIINNQWASEGLVISAMNFNGPDEVIIFNTSAPTGGDLDLGTPNQQYGGPGVGNGGGSNDVAEGNILVIAEDLVDSNNDGLVDDPDDDANGGRIYFDFTDRAVTIETVRMIDIDDNTWRIILELANGFVQTINVPNAGNNSAQTIPVFTSNVRRMVVEGCGSGGVGGFAWCPDGPQITVCNTPLDFDRDDQGGFLPAGTIINNQWTNSRNVTISAQNNRSSGPDEAILFNSAAPTGGDVDLGTPSQQYGGPGIGGGGASNVIPEGNLLIIAERLNDNNNDGLVDNPDDEARGGVLRFAFTNYASVDSIIIIDNDENNSFIVVETMGGNTTTIPINNPGDNGRMPVAINATNVSAVSVHFERSGAVADLYFCADGSPITNKGSNDAVAGAGAGGAFELENSFEAFPNPFLSETNLRFSLGYDSKVKLKVYDLRGVEVATLFEGEVSEGEQKEVGYKPESLARGIYYARLTTDRGETMVRKLIYK